MPGVGKSYLTADMAARISRGIGWPDGSPCQLGSVLLLTAEDDPADTIRPRLDAHDADVLRVHVLTGAYKRENSDDADIMISLSDVDLIESALRQITDCRLIVIDPIGSFLGGRTDAHRDNEVRSVLAPIAKLADKYGPAVLAIAHRRKNAGNCADDMALGSRAFTGLARSVWHLSKDTGDAARRLLLAGKNNLAPESHGLAYRITGDPGRIEWEDAPVTITADDALIAEHETSDAGQSALEEASDWLRETLAVSGRSSREIIELAKQDGIAKRTLDRASKKIGVIKGPDGFGGGWVWSLPGAPESTNPKRDCQATTLANTDESWRTLNNIAPDAAESEVRY